MTVVSIAGFLLALLASLTLTPLAGRFAAVRGWLDRPDGGRKLHTDPIPRVGGVSVYLSFLAALSVLAGLTPETAGDGHGLDRAYLPLALACGAVMLVGLVDDLKGVSPFAKVLAQSCAGAYLYASGFRIALVNNPFGDPINLGHFSLPLTLLWFVGMSNAFNLIDGLDGLAAGIALVATGCLLIAAIINDHMTTASLAAALAGALLGFLRYNFSPASVFLGDSGALFVGFALAAFAIRGSMKTSTAIAVAAPLLAMALPILDVALSILRRFIRGTHVFEADRDHIHHRLLHMGLTPRRAVISLYGVAALFGSLSLVLMTGPRQVLWAVVLTVVLLVWAGVRQLGYVEFSELQQVLARHLLASRRVVSNNVQLIGLREDLARARNFGELWDTLVDGADRLGFTRVELSLHASLHERLHSILVRSEPHHGFPVWSRPEASTRAAVTSWAWTIPLGDGGPPAVKVIVTRDVGAGTLEFDASYFINAVANEFAEGLCKTTLMTWASGEPSASAMQHTE